MVTGINSDVRYGDRVYHVQTQDLGTQNCTLESLVYVGGQVLGTILDSYKDIATGGMPAIRKRLIAQHRSVIISVNEGKYTEPSSAMPAAAPAAHEPPDLVVTEIEGCFVGDRGSLMMLLRSETSYQPIAGATLEVFYPPTPTSGNRIYAAKTDDRGFHLAEFRIPHVASPEPCLLVQASCSAGKAQSHLKVTPSSQDLAGTRGAQAEPLAQPFAEKTPAERVRERPCLVVSELDEPRAGAAVSFLLLLQEERSQRPIAEAGLRVLFRVEGAQAQTLYEASTDDKGFHVAEFGIPSAGGARASLLIQATCGLGVAEVIFPVTA